MSRAAMTKLTRTEKREIARMLDNAIGPGGLAWSGVGDKLIIAIHDGQGAAGGYSSAVLNNEQLVFFINKLVGSLSNPAGLTAIRALIDQALADQRRSLIRPVLAELAAQRSVITPVHALAPYSPRTAIVPVRGMTPATAGEERAA